MMYYFITIFVLYLIIMLWYSIGWYGTRVAKISTSTVIAQVKPIFTVIIPARNEAANIEACIRSIYNQDFDTTCYEVIVINDYSEDNTEVIIQKLMREYSSLKLINLCDHIKDRSLVNSFKKKALSIAIEASKGSIIVQTDADCVVPPKWLHHFYTSFQKERIQIVAAPVSLRPVKAQQRLLYWLQSIDFLTMQGITAASHFYQVGTMCNGANMAFRKSAYKKVGGFKGIDQLATGDDMLLLHKILATFPKSSHFIKSRSAVVQTDSQATWHSFLNQRIRWSAKATIYKDKRLSLLLLIVYICNFNFLLMSLIGFFKVEYLKLALSLLLIKVVVEYLLVIPLAFFFKKAVQIIVFPFLQPLHILYIIISGFLGKIKKYEWKGRIVK